MTDTMRFDASDLTDFGVAMGRAPDLVRREFTLATTEGLDQGVELAQGFAPFEDGELRESIRILEAPSVSGDVFGGAYGSDAVHAMQREYGGTIRGNPWLVFQIDGRWVKVRSVTQTGSRYMGRSRDALRPRLRRIYGSALDRVWTRIMARGG